MTACIGRKLTDWNSIKKSFWGGCHVQNTWLKCWGSSLRKLKTWEDEIHKPCEADEASRVGTSGNRWEKGCERGLPPSSLFTSMLPSGQSGRPRPWFQSCTWLGEGIWDRIGLGPACEYGADARKSKRDDRLGEAVQHLGKESRKYSGSNSLPWKEAFYQEIAPLPICRAWSKYTEPVQRVALDQKPSSRFRVEIGPKFWHAQRGVAVWNWASAENQEPCLAPVHAASRMNLLCTSVNLPLCIFK